MLDIGPKGIEILIRNHLSVLKDCDKILVLVAKEGTGILVSNIDYNVVAAFNRLKSPCTSTNITNIAYAKDEYSTMLIEFMCSGESLVMEIIAFDNHAEMLEFIDDVGLNNEWVMS